jgi:hypothetical protein
MNDERMSENDPTSARILARQLAHELTKDELDTVAGGAMSSSCWSSSSAGEGDDGGGDD